MIFFFDKSIMKLEMQFENFHLQVALLFVDILKFYSPHSPLLDKPS